ncbi:MAG: CpsD/CapB family tyrosine-protein kinase [Candidatus Brocadiae bacterium]|nr:CpsD/CapB family tyrosine-protein kinase [Candidatus Brocadiia bacterium]
MSKIQKALEKAKAQQAASATLPAAEPGRAHVVQPVGGAHVDPHLVAYHHPHSHLTESFRRLKAMIRGVAGGAQLRTIVMTSAGKGEGKSTTALNLAVVMCQDFDKRICICDADLRRPRVHRLLGITPRRGLSDVLAGEALLDDVLVTDSIPRLTVVPGGHSSKSPAEMLSSPRMAQLIEELKSRFDFIIFDTPPILTVADAIVLGPMTDGVILVIQAGKVRKRPIQRAFELLHNSKVHGFILNRGDLVLSHYGYRYYDRGYYYY